MIHQIQRCKLAPGKCVCSLERNSTHGITARPMVFVIVRKHELSVDARTCPVTGLRIIYYGPQLVSQLIFQLSLPRETDSKPTIWRRKPRTSRNKVEWRVKILRWNGLEIRRAMLTMFFIRQFYHCSPACFASRLRHQRNVTDAKRGDLRSHSVIHRVHLIVISVGLFICEAVNAVSCSLIDGCCPLGLYAEFSAPLMRSLVEATAIETRRCCYIQMADVRLNWFTSQREITVFIQPISH